MSCPKPAKPDWFLPMPPQPRPKDGAHKIIDQSTMALKNGDRVIITGGNNKGKHGTFVEHFAFASCRVVFDGRDEPQAFRHNSVKRDKTSSTSLSTQSSTAPQRVPSQHAKVDHSTAALAEVQDPSSVLLSLQKNSEERILEEQAMEQVFLAVLSKQLEFRREMRCLTFSRKCFMWSCTARWSDPNGRRGHCEFLSNMVS